MSSRCTNNHFLIQVIHHYCVKMICYNYEIDIYNVTVHGNYKQKCCTDKIFKPGWNKVHVLKHNIQYNVRRTILRIQDIKNTGYFRLHITKPHSSHILGSKQNMDGIEQLFMKEKWFRNTNDIRTLALHLNKDLQKKKRKCKSVFLETLGVCFH